MSDTKPNEIFKSMVSIATEGLKALLLVNGGAIVALLTFLGNSKNVAASQFVFPSIAFVMGLVLCFFAFCSAYATQFYLYNEQFPEREFSEGSHMKFFWGTAFFVTLSIIAFFLGAYSSVNALSTAGPTDRPSLEQTQPQVSCNCNCSSNVSKER